MLITYWVGLVSPELRSL